MAPPRDHGAVRAETMPNASRRCLLTAATVSLAGGTAMATTAFGAPVASPAVAAGDDAELLALHREFLERHAVVQAFNAGRVGEDVGEDAHDRWWECVEAMIDIAASTVAGIQAKAEAALLAWELTGGHGGPDEALVASALRDMVAWRAVA